MKLLSLFTGIGAFEKALKNIGIKYELVGFSEIDKYAIKSYCAIHNEDERKNLGDITKIDAKLLSQISSTIGTDIDMITHGSPCQDFSVAGKQAGGDMGTGTRSSLMWNTINIVTYIKPKYVIWENVKNLLGKKHKHNFDSYITIMERLGYNNYYQVLNAKDYGIPQNRERIYTISIRKDIDNENFRFPEKESLHIRLKDLLEDKVDEKYYLKEKGINYVTKRLGGYTQLIDEKTEIAHCPITALGNTNWTGNFVKEKEPKIIYEKPLERKGWHRKACEVLNPDGISTCIHTQSNNLLQKVKVIEKHKSLKPIKVGQASSEGSQAGMIYSDKGISPNLCAGTHGYAMGNIETNARIRKLTPKECWRLMGFNDDDFENARLYNSNTQLYKQAGNSIVVPVLEKIFKNLLGD